MKPMLRGPAAAVALGCLCAGLASPAWGAKVPPIYTTSVTVSNLAGVNRPVLAIGSQAATPAAWVENIVVKGLILDGNKDQQTSEYSSAAAWIRNNCIDVRKTRRLLIDNVSAAISLDNALKDCLFSDCLADANGDVGVFARNATGLRFSHCVIKSSGSFAVFLSHDDDGHGVHDILFSNCHILDNVQGLKVASTEDKSSRVTVTGCVFHGNGDTPVATDGTVISESANIVQP